MINFFKKKENKEIEPRYKIVRLSPLELVRIFEHDTLFKVAIGIPKGSVYCQSHYDFVSDTFLIKIWNKDFDIVPEWGLTPNLEDVVITRQPKHD
jgi:hypothetical protein